MTALHKFKINEKWETPFSSLIMQLKNPNSKSELSLRHDCEGPETKKPRSDGEETPSSTSPPTPSNSSPSPSCSPFEESPRLTQDNSPCYKFSTELRRVPVRLLCSNCGEYFTKENNRPISCVWYNTKHKGSFVVDWDADFWTHWDAKTMGPPEGSFCREVYGNCGGYMWSGCGCHHNYDLCERIGFHCSSSDEEDDDEDLL